ncbi:MAG: mechanosensitive ion channel family protein [Halocynthiibacter sp.]
MLEHPLIQTAMGYVDSAWAFSKGWLLSGAAWTQLSLLLVSYFAARYIIRHFEPKLVDFLSPEEGQTTILAKLRRFALLFTPIMMPLLAYAFTSLGEGITRAIFDSGAVIALGKRVFLFLAVRALVLNITNDPFLKLVGKYFLIPAMALHTVGLLDMATAYLEGTRLTLGNISFNALSVLRGIVAGSVLFWLGRWSNDQSSTYISKQEDLRPATRELVTKAIEIMIFGAAFILLMSIMGINLSALAVLGGAIGVGLGFGLQKIASNFISGVILLLEGQATVGDYVALDGGEEGTIVKMMARAAILETYDGRWIVVPNEDFITTRVVNYSDSGSANRYEAPFSVSYDTDINLIPDIIESAVSKHPEILNKPFPPDCELRGFGDNGIDFAVEFWVNGIDDGENKFTSDVLFLIWNALKEHDIEIPYPQRVVEIKGSLPQ